MVTRQISLIFFLLLFSCSDEEPKYPFYPFIEFENLDFITGEGNQPDILRLQFKLADIEGDIGLGDDDIYDPFHDFSYVANADGENINISDSVDLPFFLKIPTGQNLFRLESFSKTDNRPPFSCPDYVVEPTLTDLNDVDTLYIVRNKNRRNLFLEFIVDGEGTFNDLDSNMHSQN